MENRLVHVVGDFASGVSKMPLQDAVIPLEDALSP